MVLPDFLPVCRGTSAEEQRFLCLSRLALSFGTHYAGYSLICPGAGCELCNRGFRKRGQAALAGGRRDGQVCLLLMDPRSLDRKNSMLGRVVASKPWRRGQSAKWTWSDDVKTIRTDQVVSTSALCRVLLRMHLPESMRGHAVEGQTLESAGHVLRTYAAAVAERTTFNF